MAGALQLILKIQRSQGKIMESKRQVWPGLPRTGDLHKAQGNGSGWRPWFSSPNPKQVKRGLRTNSVSRTNFDVCVQKPSLFHQHSKFENIRAL